MRVDVDRRYFHERREADRRTCVVGELEEARDVGAEAAVQRDAVRDRGHAVLAHAEVEVASRELAGLHDRGALDLRVVRRLQVRRAADEPRHERRRLLQRGAGVHARRGLLVADRRDELRVEIRRKLRLVEARVPEVRLLGFRLAPLGEAGVPRLVDLLLLRDDLGVARLRIVGHEERGLVGPAVRGFRRLHLLDAERLAVRLRGAGLLRRAAPDDGLRADERGLAAAIACGRERALDLSDVVSVDALREPAVRVEALRDVFGEREARVAVDGDVVVVVEVDEVVELEVAGERRCLRRDAFHEIAVRDDAPHAMADGREIAGAREPRLRHLRGDRHADAVCEALAERTRRHFDAGRQAVLRVAGRLRAELAELLQLVHRQLVAEEVQQPVDEHRRVAVREDEAIAIGPLRVRRVEAEELRPEDVRHLRASEGRAGMAALRLLHAVDGEHLERENRPFVGALRGGDGGSSRHGGFVS